MSKRILHIGGYNKITKPFIELVKDGFDFENHFFLMICDSEEGSKFKNVKVSPRNVSSRLWYYIEAVCRMHRAKKIILHGLFDIKLVVILFAMPWLLKKCYWVMWGGDLYVYQLGERNWKWKVREFIRRPVIKNMGHLLTYIPGDVELARQWYDAKGKHHECLMYLSNVIDPNIIQAAQAGLEEHTGLNILVGNSADPSNNHIESLEKLLPYKEDKIKIFAPLSYGDQEHAKKVIERGKEWFGDKFVPLTSFMAFDDYLKLLKSIDIAIFNHKRQQAMGNTITLLGMGKTIFMRAGVSHYDFLKGLGIKLNDVENLELCRIARDEAKENAHVVRSYFSRATLVKQFSDIFEG